MLPNFLVIGSQKAATSSIHQVIRQHPEIYMPDKKELNFFFRDDFYRRGPSYYESFFQDAGDRVQGIGEASPGYLCKPEAPKRIKSLLPDVKLILTVRNPCERAYSQYWDNRRHLIEPDSFETAIDKYLSCEYGGGIGYFSRGVYIKYIERYPRLFSREQILVLVLDDLKKEPDVFYKTIFEFIGVNPGFSTKGIRSTFNAFSLHTNPAYSFVFRRPHLQRFLPRRLRRLLLVGPKKRVVPPSMDKESRRRLIEFYRPWNEKLGKFLGRDLSEWSQ